MRSSHTSSFRWLFDVAASVRNGLMLSRKSSRGRPSSPARAQFGKLLTCARRDKQELRGMRTGSSLQARGAAYREQTAFAPASRAAWVRPLSLFFCVSADEAGWNVHLATGLNEAALCERIVNYGRSEERLQAGLRAPQNQCVHIVRALVGIDRLQVHHVPDDVILLRDAVAAMHVAGVACDR